MSNPNCPKKRRLKELRAQRNQVRPDAVNVGDTIIHNGKEFIVKDPKPNATTKT